MNFLKLIRWPNLLLLVIMQVLVREALLSPILSAEDKGLLLTPLEFALVVFSCLCIAAGGYIINDIEDMPIDTINRPQKMIVGVKITKDTAFAWYGYLTAIGLLLGGYLTFIKEIRYVVYINAISAGMLYFYATAYKCMPLLGNIIISALTALAIVLVVMPEPLAKEDATCVSFVTAYCVFSFLLTLVRELVKDMEDIAGDRSCGCTTLPVKAGTGITKALVILATMSLVSVLAYIQILFKQWETPIPFWYLVITVELPLIYLIPKVFRASERSHFTHISNIAKLIMFTGVLSMYIFHLAF